MKFFIFFLISISISNLIACNDHTPDKGLKNTVFEADIPSVKDGGKDLLLNLKIIIDSLKLDSLNHGYDSLQIRIWFSYAYTLQQQVLILKKYKGDWTGEFYEYLPNLSKDLKEIVNVQRKVQNVSPKTSWTNFINKLYQNNIESLPDYHKLKKYELPTDGHSIIFEISTVNKYRIYVYPSPDVVVGFKETKNVTNNVEIIKEELSVKLPI